MYKKFPIIFLDIDGVLNSEESVNEVYQENFSTRWTHLPHKKHIKILDKIIDITKSKIVISSTWRRTQRWYQLGDLLYLAGLKNADVIFDSTPILNKKRGLEIQAWLDEYDSLPYTQLDNDNKFIYTSQKTKSWDIESFVILDDDTDMEHLMDRLVHINSYDGLSETDIQKVLEILKIPYMR